ncbi:MAG: hypothetical protein ABWY90_03045 [Solirubrobacterales bacterium]
MADDPAESRFALRLSSVDDLFEPYDARPVDERPLNYDARTELLDAWERSRDSEPEYLTLEVPEDERETTDEQAVRTAIGTTLDAASGPLRYLDPLSRSDRVAGLIGLATFFLCIVASTALDQLSESPFLQGLSQGLLLLGWVALWDPAARLVTEVMPHVFNRRRYAEFAGIDVRFNWR